MAILLWIACVIVTLVFAEQKKLNKVLFFFLALFLGPLAILIALAMPSSSTPTFGDLSDARNQLGEIKGSIADLQERCRRLEFLLDGLPVKEGSVPSAVVEAAVPATRAEEVPVPEKRSPGMEWEFGRYWLSKIGIVVLTLGLGFLVSYSFQYFGPVLKIVTGYALAGLVFFVGLRLESREKFIRFGRVLLGGGWALVYVTTYAMHHFSASRIISSQLLDLCLLALVVAGMVFHVLRYRSEEMMSVALLVAYLTATLGQITSFTLMSCLLLAVLVLFFVYKFQWVKTLLMAIVVTYGIHYIWVMPNIADSARQAFLFNMPAIDHRALMNLIFLTCYGSVFLAGVHIARNIKEEGLARTLAAANFGNIALYCVLAYPLVLSMFYDLRFPLVLGLGVVYLALALVMKRVGRHGMFVSDTVAAVFLVTFSIPLKFMPTSTLLIWLVEAPFLVFVGTHYREKIFRYLSYGLTVAIGLRLAFGELFGVAAPVHFAGLIWTWDEFVALWACVSMGLCFVLMRRAKGNEDMEYNDHVFDHVFSLACVACLTYLIYSRVAESWLVFSLCVEGLALAVAGITGSLRRFRAYAYAFLGLAALLFMAEGVDVPSRGLKWFLVSFPVTTMFAAYCVIKFGCGAKDFNSFFDKEATPVFWAGIVVLTSAVFQYVSPQWISLVWGVAGVAIVSCGLMDTSRIERQGGLVLLAVTLGRVILVDLSSMETMFKIITFIVLGLLLLGVSFVYNRLQGGKPFDLSK